MMRPDTFSGITVDGIRMLSLSPDLLSFNYIMFCFIYNRKIQDFLV